MRENRFLGARFDTPNYVVGQNYIREMIAYGILPEGTKAEDVDPYETDKKYIESFHPERKQKYKGELDSPKEKNEKQK